MNIQFFQRQIDQLKVGGWHALTKKVQRSVNKLALGLFARLSVYLKLPWIEAYEFYANKLLEKYRALLSQYGKDEPGLKQLERHLKGFLSEVLELRPTVNNFESWKKTVIQLSFVQFNSLAIDEQLTLIQVFDRKIKTFLKEHQLDEAAMIFMPASFAIGSIGTYENLSNYVMAKELGWFPNKKIVLLLPPEFNVRNPTYLNYWSKYITIISDPKQIRQLEPQRKCLEEPMDFYMPLNGKPILSHIAIGLLQEQWDKECRSPLLELSTMDKQRGWQVLEGLGMPKGAWFVCLHIRDRGYYKEADKDDFRNSEIYSYISAIKLVTERGGWVVRMGDPAMRPLPAMSNVIDYAHSSIKSDWMDVFLCAQSQFFIGTASGLFMVSTAFGVPSALTNYLPAFAVYCLSQKDLFIPRLCREKKGGRYLRFDELIAPPVGIMSSKYAYDRQGIEITDNSPEEIYDLVEEMLDRQREQLKYSREDEFLQEQFKTTINRLGKLYGDEKVAVNARIGRKFLAAYEELLSSNKEVVKSVG